MSGDCGAIYGRPDPLSIRANSSRRRHQGCGGRTLQVGSPQGPEARHEIGEDCLTVWNWILENSEAIRVVILSLGVVGGLVGLCFARWRCLTADRNLLRERCQMGMELLSLNPERYAARVAGASILSDILDDRSSKYDEAILRAFEAHLFAPSFFGGNIAGHKTGETDYESRDTYLVVSALRRYTKKQGSLPLLSLPPGLRFTITRNTVEPNKDHEHYKRWMEAKGKPPEYGD